MSGPFPRPNDTSSGGAGGGALGGYSGGSGRVSIADPPRPRPFPWPLPFSATQGAIGGAGGVGKVSVPLPPWYQKDLQQWPYQWAFTTYLMPPPIRA